MVGSSKLPVTRASRRGVLKGGAALGLGSLASGPLASRGVAAQGDNQLEVFSWWTSPGEAPALQALFDAYSAKYADTEIINAAVAGGAGVNAIAVLLTRLQGNEPPDSWQTHIGRELIDQYVVPGYCEPITRSTRKRAGTTSCRRARRAGDGERAVLDPGRRPPWQWVLVQQASHGGQRHRGRRHDDARRVRAADTLKAAGIPALALAMKDTFAGAQTFENTALGTVGPDTYNALFKG